MQQIRERKDKSQVTKKKRQCNSFESPMHKNEIKQKQCQ